MHELVFELSGPYYDLAIGEIEGVLEGQGYEHRILSVHEGTLLVETDAEPKAIGDKLGLSHRVLYHLITTEEENLIEGNTGITIPPGSAAVMTRRIAGRKVETMDINKGLGNEISRNNPIDLERPEHTIIVLVSDRCIVGRLAHTIDKKPLASRLVKNRPYFSPISLEPKYARALVNLARPSEGITIHDPFCGTGGILLEAADMGYLISGGDTDRRMVEGCKKNLHSFGFDVDVFEGDVSDNIPDEIDRIVTDPPYGRSSSSQGEEVDSIYRRFLQTAREKLKVKGYLSVIFPNKKYYRLGSEYLTPVEIYRTRVHSSLERYFCLYRKD